MAQTHEGALKVAAAKAGIGVSDYLSKQAAGMKWCTGCKEWHRLDLFGKDVARFDGRAASCLAYRSQHPSYGPVPLEARKPMGIPRDSPRGGDKKQARKSVNLMVRTGRMSRPGDLPCFDCGHIGSGPRHEYDHYLGYGSEYHLTVQAVCSACHTKREVSRGKWGRRKSSG